MNTLVRIAVAAGQDGSGVEVQYGSQKASIPVGGVQTFALLDGHTMAMTVCTAPCQHTGLSDVADLESENAALKAQVAHLEEQLAAVHKAVGDEAD